MESSPYDICEDCSITNCRRVNPNMCLLYLMVQAQNSNLEEEITTPTELFAREVRSATGSEKKRLLAMMA